MSDLDPHAAPAEHASAPPPAAVHSDMSDGEWHRLHPLTPLLRGGLFLVVVIGIIIANLRDRLVSRKPARAPYRRCDALGSYAAGLSPARGSAM